MLLISIQIYLKIKQFVIKYNNHNHKIHKHKIIKNIIKNRNNCRIIVVLGFVK